MKIVLFIVTVIIAFQLKSQSFFPTNYDTLIHKREWNISGLGDLGTTSINNALFSKLLVGGSIDSILKKENLENHGPVNRMGLALQTEFNYINYRQKKTERKVGFILKTGVYGVGTAVYSKDLFGVLFEGNQNYLGKTIDFSGSKFDFMSFQKLGIGLIHKKTKSYLTLNAYAINSYVKGGFQNGQIYQTSNGDSLSVLLSGDVTYTSFNSLFNGFGIGIDGEYNLPFLINENRLAILQISVKNIGIGFLTNPVENYNMRFGKAYNGLTFQQIFDLNSGYNQTALLDSLGIQKTSLENQMVVMPGFIQIGKIATNLTERKLQSIFGIRILIVSGYSPLVYAGLNYKLNNFFQFGGVASYGGFSNFRASAYGMLQFKRLALKIASENVLGDLSSRGMGQAYSFSINYSL